MMREMVFVLSNSERCVRIGPQAQDDLIMVAGSEGSLYQIFNETRCQKVDFEVTQKYFYQK